MYGENIMITPNKPLHHLYLNKIQKRKKRKRKKRFV
jgi:hypothetical protein